MVALGRKGVRSRWWRIAGRWRRVGRPLAPVLWLWLLGDTEVRPWPLRRQGRCRCPGQVAHRVREALHTFQEVWLVVRGAPCTAWWLSLLQGAFEGLHETIRRSQPQGRTRRYCTGELWLLDLGWAGTLFQLNVAALLVTRAGCWDTHFIS